MIARSEALNVAGMRVQMMATEDVMTTKLLAQDEHALDLEPLGTSTPQATRPATRVRVA